jgi:hypothetical protein
MKTLKFANHLVNDILEGRKTATWRLFDDKDLSVKDRLRFIDSNTGETFAEAEVKNVREKKLGQVEKSDFQGHEKFSGPKAMLLQYRKYYGDAVTMDSPVKIIDFKILRLLK